MENEILTLAKKFIAIKSDPENKEALRDILDVATQELPDCPHEFFEKNGTKSVLFYNTRERPKKFKILLNGHLDVIPAKAEQYTPVIKGKKLYGAGAMDMKANVACLISAFKEVKDIVQYPMGLQLVTDEEVGGFDGTKYQIEQGVKADFVLAGEPTNFDIVNKAKGVLWMKITAKGKTAHGAYPWRGNNAVWRLHEFLEKLRKEYPTPKKEKWVTTVNLSKIETPNDSFNKIPDTCVAWLDIRFIGEESKTILKKMRKMLSKDLALNVVANEPALDTSSEDAYILSLQNSLRRIHGKKSKIRGAQGSSDARHFARIGCPGIEFGPIGDGIGSDAEWVDIQSLATYQKILVDFLKNS